MKKSSFLSFVIALLFSHFLQAEQFLIDKIEAVIFGHEDTVIVTKSDVDRLTLDGRYRSLDDVIMEKLMFQEAKKYKIVPDENAINRYLAAVQRESNLSLADLKAMFSTAGYTYEEGRAQLGIMQAVNSFLDFRIRSRLIVLDRDVQAYYNDHPKHEEAAYRLKVAVIPFDANKEREVQKKEIEDRLRLGKKIVGTNWSDPFWINKPDIAQEKKFIFNLKPGMVSKPRKSASGFELFVLIDFRDQRLVPLEERYQEISRILIEPMHETLKKEMEQELLGVSSIVRF